MRASRLSETRLFESAVLLAVAQMRLFLCFADAPFQPRRGKGHPQRCGDRASEKQFHEENPHKENVADVYYRRIPGRRPLLIIHPVALQFKNNADYEKWLRSENGQSPSVWPSATHVEETVGWSISFPEVGIRKRSLMSITM